MQFLQQLVFPGVVGNKIPIICNQENFIIKSNSYRIFQAVPGFNFFVKPAVKDIQDRGRPKNGMFIGIPDSIRQFVKDVSPNHWQVQAVIVELKSSKTLLINSYFPTDYRETTYRGDDLELTETIQVIKTVLKKMSLKQLFGLKM